MRTASLVLATVLGALAPAPVHQIDPQRSVARFTVTKLGYSDVVGTFRESAGQIDWNPADPSASSIRWSVSVASVQTDARNRDRSLQGREYFDARNHPHMTFESTSVRARADGRLDVAGRLTIRGVTRQQTVIVRHNGDGAAPVFETDFDIDRYDFGITGGSVMGRLIGRTVRIHLRVVTKETL